MFQAENRDGARFATVRRGYDPEAVELRIAELEQQIEQLKKRLEHKPTLAESASDRIQDILAVAEQTARELATESEDQARLTARKAEQNAEKTRERAEDQAAERISQVNEAADHLQSTSERLEQGLEAQLDDVRVGLAKLSDEIDGICANISQEANAALDDGRLDEPNWRSSDVQELVDGGAGVDDGPTDTDEAIQLVAQNMAENGSTREQTADYLAETFGIDDPEPFVEEAYGVMHGNGG